MDTDTILILIYFFDLTNSVTLNGFGSCTGLFGGNAEGSNPEAADVSLPK